MELPMDIVVELSRWRFSAGDFFLLALVSKRAYSAILSSIESIKQSSFGSNVITQNILFSNPHLRNLKQLEVHRRLEAGPLAMCLKSNGDTLEHISIEPGCEELVCDARIRPFFQAQRLPSLWSLSFDVDQDLTIQILRDLPYIKELSLDRATEADIPAHLEGMQSVEVLRLGSMFPFSPSIIKTLKPLQNLKRLVLREFTNIQEAAWAAKPLQVLAQRDWYDEDKLPTLHARFDELMHSIRLEHFPPKLQYSRIFSLASGSSDIYRDCASKIISLATAPFAPRALNAFLDITETWDITDSLCEIGSRAMLNGDESAQEKWFEMARSILPGGSGLIYPARKVRLDVWLADLFSQAHFEMFLLAMDYIDQQNVPPSVLDELFNRSHLLHSAVSNFVAIEGVVPSRERYERTFKIIEFLVKHRVRFNIDLNCLSSFHFAYGRLTPVATAFANLTSGDTALYALKIYEIFVEQAGADPHLREYMQNEGSVFHILLNVHPYRLPANLNPAGIRYGFTKLEEDEVHQAICKLEKVAVEADAADGFAGAMLVAQSESLRNFGLRAMQPVAQLHILSSIEQLIRKGHPAESLAGDLAVPLIPIIQEGESNGYEVLERLLNLGVDPNGPPQALEQVDFFGAPPYSWSRQIPTAVATYHAFSEKGHSAEPLTLLLGLTGSRPRWLKRRSLNSQSLYTGIYLTLLVSQPNCLREALLHFLNYITEEYPVPVRLNDPVLLPFHAILSRKDTHGSQSLIVSMLKAFLEELQLCGLNQAAITELVNRTDCAGMTALHHLACQDVQISIEESIEALKILIQSGANVSLEAEDFGTPLHAYKMYCPEEQRNSLILRLLGEPEPISDPESDTADGQGAASGAIIS